MAHHTSRGMAYTAGSLLAALALLGACGGPSAQVSGEDPGPNEPVRATPSLAPGSIRWASEEPPRPGEDLADLLANRELRVLVLGMGEALMPRLGSPREVELARVELVARALGLPVRYVAVRELSQLTVALLEGRGDLIASRFTITPKRQAQVLFTRPLRYIGEVVVVAASREVVPSSLDELTGVGLAVRRSSSFAEILASAPLVTRGALTLELLDGSLDTYDVLEAVGRGEIPATVCDSHALASYLTYRTDATLAFTLRDDVAIAWAMRPTARVLAARLDTLISTLVVPESETRPTGGDLQTIRARGVLRVAMPNNANSFFFHSGHPMGRQYDFAQQVATEMGVRLEVIVPRKHSDLMGLVIERHVDAVAPWLSITPERRQRVRFSAPTMFVDEVLIQRSSEGAISRAEDLDGRSIHVRAGSSYRQHLGALLARSPGLRIVEVPEEISTHTLVDRVASGEIDLTVADYDILALALASGRGVRGSLLVGSQLARAFAVHPEAGELLSVLNSFIESKRAAEPRIHQAFVPPNPGDPSMGLARARMEDWRAAMEALPPDLVAAANRACQGSRVDPRLLLAQSAVASGHDPKRVSPAGGRGLLQIRPHVARDLGYGEVDLTQPDHAFTVGKAYLESILAALPDDLPQAERLPMALAAFRVGSEHLSDARALARDLGYGADRWKGGVARALRLLERPEYAARARYGYAPGADAVVYAETVMEALASLRVP